MISLRESFNTPRIKNQADKTEENNTLYLSKVLTNLIPVLDHTVIHVVLSKLIPDLQN